MAIGITATPGEINNLIGNKARDFFALYTTAKTLAQRLALYSDADLAAIGFAAADIALIHQFEGFVAQLCGVFDGTQALPTATNFLQQISGILGPGV